MATITGYTAERMQAIEDGTVIDGEVLSGHLILTKHDGTQIDTGSVIGPPGPIGNLPDGVAVGQASVWDGSNWVAAKLVDANIDPAAAISPSKLANYPNDSSKVLGGDGVWKASAVTYRKITSKQVVNTIAETDLLSGEITIPANVMSTNKLLRLLAFGDWKNNAGDLTALPRFKVTFGGILVFDTESVL